MTFGRMLGMTNKLVTIGVYGDPIVAGVAKTKLDSEGVFSFIADEMLMNSPQLRTVINEVRLQVREVDVLKAKKILKIK